MPHAGFGGMDAGLGRIRGDGEGKEVLDAVSG